jgi:hypothetical protein
LRIVRSLGWSLQRPQRRMREQDPAAVLHWRNATWRRIKKKRAKKAGRSSSSTKAGS